MTRVVTVLIFALPVTAGAQMFGTPGESPRGHQFELKFGSYRPDIDGENLSAKPYEAVFGGDGMFLTKIEYDWQFWQGFGSLALAGEIGYGQVTGNGFKHGTTEASSDETTMHLLPMSLGLAYHLDVFATRWEVPLVPYVKLGIDYHIWWITNGVGDTSEYVFDDVAAGTRFIFDGAGDTWGWHFAGGLKILLDDFAPRMARTFDTEVGVNNSYLFAEFLYADVSDFGSDESFQLGDVTGLFGIAFEF